MANNTNTTGGNQNNQQSGNQQSGNDKRSETLQGSQSTQASQQPRDEDGQFVSDDSALNKTEDVNSRGSQGDNATRGQQSQDQDGKKGAGQGFDKMDPNQQRDIASQGGQAVSQDRGHMAEIGKKGGEASGGNTGSSGNGNR